MWTPSYVAQHIPGGQLRRVKRLPSAHPGWLFPSDQPMRTEPDFMRGYEPHYSWHNMSSAAFFHLLGLPVSDFAEEKQEPEDPAFAADQAYQLNYAAPIEDWGPMVQDIDTLPLIPKPINYQEGMRLFEDPWVWVGGAGAVTPCHYDNYQNFYLMIHGHKHFLLFPPSEHDKLYLYSALHPAHRSAQVRLDQLPSAGQDARFPVSASAQAVEADLHTHEILFIPAMWFHHVTTKAFTMAVNVWSEFDAGLFATETYKRWLPFWEDEQTPELKTQILRNYLELVLSDVLPDSLLSRVPAYEGSDAARRFVRYHLLERRFRYLGLVDKGPDHDATPKSRSKGLPPSGKPQTLAGAQPGQPTWPRFCGNDGVVVDFIAKGDFGLEILRSTLHDVCQHLTYIHRLAGHDRFALYLLNFLEMSVNQAVGTRAVHQFLHDFVHC